MEIGEQVLNSPEPRTPEDEETMRQHTLLVHGCWKQLDAYRDEDFVRVAYEICRWHHERYDGSGYPDQLVGEQIPIAARVVGLADAYETLTTGSGSQPPVPTRLQCRCFAPARPGRSIRCCWTACGRSRTRSTMPCVVGRRPYKSDRGAARTGKRLPASLSRCENESPVLARRRRLCYTVKNTVEICKKQEEITFETSASVCAPRGGVCAGSSAVRLHAGPGGFGSHHHRRREHHPDPCEEENCLSWLFGSNDTITMPYLNIKGKGLRRNVTLDLVDCLVGITYTELGSIGSYVSASAAQQAWKAQAVAIHSYLEYHKQYGSSANALIYTPVDQIPASAR